MKATMLTGFVIFIFLGLSKSQASSLKSHYKFASIEHLIEQKVGSIVLQKIYSNIFISMQITAQPANRAQLSAVSGTKDGEVLRIWQYGEENPSLIRVPTPYYYLETMPYVLKNSDINITTPEQLKTYFIGKVRGVKHTNVITRGFIRLYNSASTEDMFNLLNKGRIDIALTNTLDGDLVLKRMQDKSIMHMAKPLNVLPLYHYLHPSHYKLSPLVNNEIKRLIQTGDLAILIEQAEKEVIGKELAK
ncbi:substrate-binding periplasmic protein [Algibacillus agarilyticus]|uniref:substrate-binding periplasmic protein n=1 Tax=Algibacillus agarilyticus TaxID=2234133 RepID=UPI000DD04869|nr:transporter substrate-binding domain-containing protein [Algibacillus agarilyticus]